MEKMKFLKLSKKSLAILLYYRDNLGESFYADYTMDDNNNYYLSQILSLEDSDNLLQNPSFELELGSTWVDKKSGILTRGTGVFGDENNHHLVLTANTIDTRVVVQNVPLDGKSGDVYVVGSMAHANAPIPNEEHFVGIEVYPLTEILPGFYTVSDNTNAIYRLAFDSTIDNDTQFRIGAFELEEDVVGFQFRLVYAMQNGEAYFDDALLYKSSTENVSFFNPNNTTEDTDTSNTPAETITTYNNKGLIISETSYDGNSSMMSQYAYNSDYFNTSWTDNNNVTTNYVYDSTGSLSQKSVGNNTTTYKYTPVGALKEVSTAVSGLTDNISKIKTTYTYSGDRIESIVHNNTTFKLNYNSFGNVKSV